MPTDREYLKLQQAGALGTSGATSPLDEVDHAHSGVFVFDKASDDAMASTTTAETYTGVYLPRKCKVLAVYFIPTTGGVTADNTNYATVTVSKRDSAAANKATIGTITTTITSSGNLTQGVAEASVLASGAASVAAGSTVTFEVAKAGTGVVLRAGRFSVHVSYI